MLGLMLVMELCTDKFRRASLDIDWQADHLIAHIHLSDVVWSLVVRCKMLGHHNQHRSQNRPNHHLGI